MTNNILYIMAIVTLVAQVLITFNYKKLMLDGELMIFVHMIFFIILLTISQTIPYYEDNGNHNLSGYVIIIE